MRKQKTQRKAGWIPAATDTGGAIRRYWSAPIATVPAMPHFPRVVAGLLTVLLTACANLPTTPPASLTFVIVRHAEKAQDDPRDPMLTDAGRSRAAALASALADAPITAVYATQYHRSRQTAAPTARAHGLPIIAYDAGQSANILAARLRQSHRAGQVLVVAHSNTAPAIAAALCGCEVAPMDESEYGRRMTVHIAGNGAATLISASVP